MCFSEINTEKSSECKINVICINLMQLLLYRKIKYNFTYFFKCGLTEEKKEPTDDTSIDVFSQ